MAGPTSHRLTYCSINLFPTSLTRCGRARFARTLRCCPAGKGSGPWISRSARFLLSPVNEDDSISPSSSTFAPAGLSAGRWPSTCPANWSLKPWSKPSARSPGTCRAIFHRDRGRPNAAVVPIARYCAARACVKAWTESFIGTLKVEKLQGARFIDAVGARTELSASIDSYYNTHRQHSSLSCKLPSKFEADLPFKN